MVTRNCSRVADEPARDRPALRASRTARRATRRRARCPCCAVTVGAGSARPVEREAAREPGFRSRPSARSRACAPRAPIARTRSGVRCSCTFCAASVIGSVSQPSGRVRARGRTRRPRSSASGSRSRCPNPATAAAGTVRASRGRRTGGCCSRDSCSAAASATVTAWSGSPRRLPTAAIVVEFAAWSMSSVYVVVPVRHRARRRRFGMVPQRHHDDDRAPRRARWRRHRRRSAAPRW